MWNARACPRFGLRRLACALLQRSLSPSRFQAAASRRTTGIEDEQEHDHEHEKPDDNLSGALLILIPYDACAALVPVACLRASSCARTARALFSVIGKHQVSSVEMARKKAGIRANS